MATADIPTINLSLTHKEAQDLRNVLWLYSPVNYEYCNAKGMPGANEMTGISDALQSVGVEPTVVTDPPPVA